MPPTLGWACAGPARPAIRGSVRPTARLSGESHPEPCRDCRARSATRHTGSLVTEHVTESDTRGIDQRPQERHGPQPRGPAVVRRGVPARQARQGPGVRADQAQARPVRQGRRQDVQRGPEGRDRQRRPPRHAVPLQGRDRLRLHGRVDLRPDPHPARRSSATPPTTSWRTRTRRSRRTRARSSTSSCPTSVVLEITYTEPGLQGDRSTGGTKPATLETGATINVPLFLEQGTKVKVDTRDGSYLGRVN